MNFAGVVGFMVVYSFFFFRVILVVCIDIECLSTVTSNTNIQGRHFHDLSPEKRLQRVPCFKTDSFENPLKTDSDSAMQGSSKPIQKLILTQKKYFKVKI